MWYIEFWPFYVFLKNPISLKLPRLYTSWTFANKKYFWSKPAQYIEVGEITCKVGYPRWYAPKVKLMEVSASGTTRLVAFSNSRYGAIDAFTLKLSRNRKLPHINYMLLTHVLLIVIKHSKFRFLYIFLQVQHPTKEKKWNYSCFIIHRLSGLYSPELSAYEMDLHRTYTPGETQRYRNEF